MNFLKAKTIEGKTEYFNANNILTITPLDNGNIKILMGAGLYYFVQPDSLKQINNIIEELNNENLC